jgi:hypothetical protein
MKSSYIMFHLLMYEPHFSIYATLLLAIADKLGQNPTCY